MENEKAQRGTHDSRLTLVMTGTVPMLGAAMIAALGRKVADAVNTGLAEEPQASGIAMGALIALGTLASLAIAAVTALGTRRMLHLYRNDREAEAAEQA